MIEPYNWFWLSGHENASIHFLCFVELKSLLEARTVFVSWNYISLFINIPKEKIGFR